MNWTYDEFEDELKDLLSWYQKAASDLEKEQLVLRQKGHPPIIKSTTLENARLAILNHCRKYNKELKTHHGIL